MKYVGKILSWTVCGIGIGICVLMLVMFALDGDGEISDLVWTREMIEEYNRAPEDFSVEYIKVYDDHFFTQDGYFAVSASRWIPSVQQWQFTVRYNKSTLEALGKERGEVMAVEDDHFTFALHDSDGNVYTDFEYKRETKGRYTYYRLVFDDVDIKKIDDIMIRIYCIGDMTQGSYPDVTVGELPLYYARLPREEYDYDDQIPSPLAETGGMLSSKELLIQE